MNKVSIVSLVSLLLFSVNVCAQFKMSKGSTKVATTMAIIENLYVDRIDEDKLAEDAVKSILEKLDPHSTYISADEVRDLNEPLEGNFDGIGIAFNMLTDTVYVIETIAGGPSEKIGIRPGDKIIYANDTLIAGVKRSTKDIMSRLKGKKGTIVELKILRKGFSELLEFKVTRDKIPVNSLEAAYMVDDKVGYIYLNKFSATTAQEFKDACKTLKEQGMEDLILDLEGNGGGYLSAAIELADEFLDKDKLIVYTEGSRHPKNIVKATAKGSMLDGKLVILIDGGSASASEIVSGAIQDWDRGVIVGRRSFGKGLVQRQFPLPDLSMLRLTVARYYTPTGRCIQRPYTNGDADAYNKDVIDRYNNGELVNADSIHFPDSLKFQTLVSERTVYGNGGIMPDYYVAIDTTHNSKYALKLSFKGLIFKLAYSIVDNERETIKAKYKDSEDFRRNFEVTEDVLQKLIAMGEEEKIEYNEEEYERSKPILKQAIKNMIARDLYDTKTALRIINDNSHIYQKALEIIKDDKLYEDFLKKK